MAKVKGSTGKFIKALSVGDISSVGKKVLEHNPHMERHRTYLLQCVRCGKQTNTSIKSYYNPCRSCSSRPGRYQNTTTLERALYIKYRSRADRDETKFNLSFEKFSELVHEDCYYCGSKPSQIMSVQRKIDNILIYNGVDRINNEDYDDSCVSCCWKCNQAKRNYTIDEWKAMVMKWSEKVHEW